MNIVFECNLQCFSHLRLHANVHFWSLHIVHSIIGSFLPLHFRARRATFPSKESRNESIACFMCACFELASAATAS